MVSKLELRWTYICAHKNVQAWAHILACIFSSENFAFYWDFINAINMTNKISFFKKKAETVRKRLHIGKISKKVKLWSSFRFYAIDYGLFPITFIISLQKQCLVHSDLLAEQFS